MARGFVGRYVHAVMATRTQTMRTMTDGLVRVRPHSAGEFAPQRAAAAPGFHPFARHPFARLRFARATAFDEADCG